MQNSIKIFDGKDICVTRSSNLPGRSIIVSFTPRRPDIERRGPRRLGFAEQVFIKYGVPYICFISKYNHWWQTDEMKPAVEAATQFTRSYEHAVSYGVSMGAFGALISADRLGVSDVLAFSPQVDLDDAMPLHPLWRRDLSNWKVQSTLEDLPSSGTRVFCVYDPLVKADRKHAEALKARCNVVSIRTPNSGHSSSAFLAELGVLRESVLNLVDNSINASTLRAAVRAGSRRHPGYLSRAASKLSHRGCQRGAASFRRAAAEALRSSDIIIPAEAYHICWNLVMKDQAGDPQGLIRAANMYCHREVYKEGRLSLIFNGNALLGNKNECNNLFQELKKINKNSSRPHLLMALLCTTKRDRTKFIKHLHLALEKSGCKPFEWAQLLRAAQAADFHEFLALFSHRVKK